MNYTNKAKTIKIKELRAFEHGSTLPKSATFWMRSDGIFIFRIELENLDNSGDSPQEISDIENASKYRLITQKAKLVSLRIKENYRSRCELNGMLLSSKRSDQRSFNTISTSPRKLVSAQLDGLKNDEEIRVFLNSTSNLLSLKAQYLGKSLDVQSPALLLMRRQFSGCFESAYDLASEIKYRKIRLPTIERRDGKLNLSLSKVGIKIKGWRFITTVFVLLAFSLSVLIAFNSSAFGDDYLRVDLKKFLDALMTSLSFLASAFLTIFVFVEVFFKRNKCIKAYNKAQTVMRAGNTYCEIVKNILLDVERKENKCALNNNNQNTGTATEDMSILNGIFFEGNCSESIGILEEWKTSEIRKKRIIQFVCIPLIFATSIPLSMKIEEESPDLFRAINQVLHPYGVQLPSQPDLTDKPKQKQTLPVTNSNSLQ